MTQHVVLSGMGSKELGEALRLMLTDARPSVVGIAAAFVSVQGVREVRTILRQSGRPKCRLVAGTDHAITHPQALYMAREEGWVLRLGKAQQPRGIFHPKMIVAGRRFNRFGLVEQLSCLYVGSSNLTVGGLSKNVECGLLASADHCSDSAADAFAAMWSAASPASNSALRNYSATFAERARTRRVSELSDLGVNDTESIPSRSIELRAARPPLVPAIGPEFAIAAWTGLQSFTGEYRFQVEFPRSAGEVIRRLVRVSPKPGGRTQVYCPDDECIRPMQYKFYSDNSMFRLNIPNDAPGVEWARANHDGVALLEKGPPGGAPLRLRILKPGAEASEIVGRSAALGTWGKTPTRSYGWY